MAFVLSDWLVNLVSSFLSTVPVLGLGNLSSESQERLPIPSSTSPHSIQTVNMLQRPMSVSQSMCVKKRPLGRTEMSLSWGTGTSKHTTTVLPSSVGQLSSLPSLVGCVVGTRNPGYVELGPESTPLMDCVLSTQSMYVHEARGC